MIMDREAVCAVFLAKELDPATTSERFAGSHEHEDKSERTELYPVVGQMVVDPSRVSDDVLDPPEAMLGAISQAEWRRRQLADKTVNGDQAAGEREAFGRVPRTKGGARIQSVHPGTEASPYERRGVVQEGGGRSGLSPVPTGCTYVAPTGSYERGT